MGNTLLWLLAVELLGLLAFPVAFRLCGYFQDRGYGLSKALGLLLLTYPLWILGSMGVPMTRPAVLLLLAVLAGLSCVLAWRQRLDMLAFLRREWRLLLALEGVFLLVFTGWALFRSFDPMINHTEQLMDLGLLSAAAKATTFPPQDPWLLGHTVNYYYFGYLMVATLAEITGIATSVAYNLGMALVPALAAVGLLGLAVTLVMRCGASRGSALLCGLAAVVLLGLMANLEGVLELARVRGLGSPAFWEGLDIKGLEAAVAQTSWYPEQGWWWWRATRVIDTVESGVSLDYTIQEFPLFSFMLGDLHPHMMSIPFLLLTLALGLQLLATPGHPSRAWFRDHWALLLVTGLALGALGAINAWDLPTFMALATALVGVKAYRDWRSAGRWQAVGGAGALALLLGGVATVAYAPYYQGLAGDLHGILPVEGPTTQPHHFLIVWGVFLVALAPFVVLQIARGPRDPSPRLLAASVGLAVAPFLAWVGAVAAMDSEAEVIPRLLHLLPGMAVTGALAYRCLTHARDGAESSLVFALGLLVFAAFLLTGPELFRVADLFGNRMNTVFKLSYQAWVVLPVASSVGLYYGASLLARRGWRERVGLAWMAVLALAVLGGVYYAGGALTDKANAFRGPQTLDGLAFLKEARPGEYEAIRWLAAEASQDDGVLEAVGPDYSDHGRISAATGVPTVLGWAGHERQWRGGYTLFEGREQAVERIYRGDSQAEELLAQFDVDYVVVGPRERERYDPVDLAPLDDVLEQAFTSGEVTIYRVKGRDG